MHASTDAARSDMLTDFEGGKSVEVRPFVCNILRIFVFRYLGKKLSTSLLLTGRLWRSLHSLYSMLRDNARRCSRTGIVRIETPRCCARTECNSCAGTVFGGATILRQLRSPDTMASLFFQDLSRRYRILTENAHAVLGKSARLFGRCPSSKTRGGRSSQMH